MSTLFLPLAGGCTLIAASAFYLSSPHQQWIDALHAKKRLRFVGTAICFVALFFLLQEFSLIASIFMFVALMMLCCSLLPLVIAYVRAQQGKAPPRPAKERAAKDKRSLPKQKYSSSNWLPHTLAGIFLGFLLSVGLTGLGFRYGFDPMPRFSVESQFLMWMIAPLWVSILGLCFLWRSSVKTLVVLIASNLVVWLMLYADVLLKGAL